MAIIEAIIAYVFGLIAKDIAVPITEDVISGKVTAPAPTVTIGYVDPAVDQAVLDAINNPAGKS